MTGDKYEVSDEDKETKNASAKAAVKKETAKKKAPTKKAIGAAPAKKSLL